jgi:hypothetical protein
MDPRPGPGWGWLAAPSESFSQYSVAERPAMKDTPRALPPPAQDAAPIHAARGKAHPARGAHPLGLPGTVGGEHVDLPFQGNESYRRRH